MTTIRDLLLPVETANRELDGKLLLALFAAEAGFSCHIGVMSRIQSAKFPPSVYLSKSVRFAKPVRLMRNLGHLVVSWDEEGLARFHDFAHGSRIEPEAFQIPKLLFSWGQSNTDMWKSHPCYDGTPIVNSGNPRIDLLRPELRALIADDVNQLREVHGPFVLLNSNFGIVNHFKVGGRKTKIGRTSHDPEFFVNFQRGVKEHKRALLQKFLEGVPTIAKSIFPHKLVIRPHPSEDHGIWHEAARENSNVEVIHQGPVAPWLVAARCLIHNGCTSAVEAAVVGLPALAFQPVVSNEFDIVLPNALSERFDSVQDLAVRAAQLVKSEIAVTSEAKSGPLLSYNVSALEGALAGERIVKALLELTASHQVETRKSVRYLKTVLKNSLRTAVKQFSSESLRYERHKSDFSIFTVEKIALRSAVFQSVLGRFSGVSFKAHSQGVVTILPAS